MPTYTYRCTRCGHEFERFQSMADEPVKRCPECKSKVMRTFNPVGIVLKGSGFHRNDYRSPSKKSSSGSEKSESDSKSEKKSETKSESKSASKSSESKSSEKKPSSGS